MKFYKILQTLTFPILKNQFNERPSNHTVKLFWNLRTCVSQIFKGINEL